MGDLIYSMGVSLDGFVEDAKGSFDWSEPDDDIHRLANQQARSASAFVYGRRMFEIMDEYWMQAAREEGHPPIEAEFAEAYAATPRYVVSDTMTEASNGATLVPRGEARSLVERLKRESTSHIGIAGPEFAASMIDLIDEFCMWVSPVAVGGGKPFFPTGKRLDLELVECTHFPSGTLWQRYRRRLSDRDAILAHSISRCQNARLHDRRFDPRIGLLLYASRLPAGRESGHVLIVRFN